MEMRHELVGDHRFPVGVNWLMVRETTGETYLFVRESLCVHDCGCCPVLNMLEREMAAS